MLSTPAVVRHVDFEAHQTAVLVVAVLVGVRLPGLVGVGGEYSTLCVPPRPSKKIRRRRLSSPSPSESWSSVFWSPSSLYMCAVWEVRATALYMASVARRPSASQVRSRRSSTEPSMPLSGLRRQLSALGVVGVRDAHVLDVLDVGLHLRSEEEAVLVVVVARARLAGHVLAEELGLDNVEATDRLGTTATSPVASTSAPVVGSAFEAPSLSQAAKANARAMSRVIFRMTVLPSAISPGAFTSAHNNIQTKLRACNSGKWNMRICNRRCINTRQRAADPTT